MDNIEDLKRQMEEMAAMLAEAKAMVEPVENAVNELKGAEQEAYRAYQEQVAKIRAQRSELDEKAYEARRQINKINYEIEVKQRALATQIKEQERAEREAARRKELDALNASWDKLTLAASWREWAKDHQISAGHYITEHRKVILADPMGLGKTLSSIIVNDMAEAASRHASPESPFLGEDATDYNGNTVVVNGVTRPVGKRVLYFCPASLIRNVVKEYRMWANHRNVVFIGGMTKAERDFAFNYVLKDRADFIVVCNYEAWRKDLSLIDKFIELDPDTVIMDEAHNIKDRKTSGFRGIRRLLDEANPEYIIPMTGTPILNRPQELFTLLNLVNDKEFYHENDFLYSFCEQDENGFWKFQPGGLDRVAKRIRKNFLRRTKDQAGISLPEKSIIHHDLDVDVLAYPEQAKVREQMRMYATIMIDEAEGKSITAAAAIAMYTRLRQIETWPAGIEQRHPITKEVVFNVDVEESQKVDYVIGNSKDSEGVIPGLIPELIEDERIVLFSQFKAPLRELKRRIEMAGFSAVILDGETSQEDREIIANDFDRRYTPDRTNARFDVVLCNYKVGGVGINLTAATQMIILDEEWNPGKRDQAYDRIHRIGQEEAVTIHVIRNLKTVDDWLAGIMENKEGLVEGFNSAMVDVKDFKDFLDNGGLI